MASVILAALMTAIAGAERTLQDEIMTLDGRRHDQIFDFYEISRQINPDPGERFVAE